MLACPIAMPMKAFCELPDCVLPLPPPANIFSACIAAAVPMELVFADWFELLPPPKKFW